MTKKNVSEKMTAAQAGIVNELQALSTTLLDRQRLASVLGKQYGGSRDLYETLGYKKTPVFSDYEAFYRRHEIAKAVINAPVSASWETFPLIEESDEADTAFEKAASEIITKFKLQQIFSRVDTLCSIGKYAVLLLGFKDGAKSLSEPAVSASELIYATPYGEGSVAITTFDENPQSARFGLPTKYTIKTGSSSKSTDVQVDHTRVIHVAQECLTNPFEGTPQLEVIFNRLFDIEKLVGADAEAFWRLADPGMTFKTDKEFTLTEDDKLKFEEKILDFIHRLKKHLVLQGVEAKELVQQLADPEHHFSMLLDMVAAGKRIPKRVLLGSELGELASTMDLVRWFRQIKSRREQFCEPVIIRPFFDRLIEVGVLKRTQENEYNVKWDDLLAPSDKEKADVGDVLARALAAYLNSGGDSRVPIEDFLGWLGRPKEEIERIMESMSTIIDDEPNLEIPVQPKEEEKIPAVA